MTRSFLRYVARLVWQWIAYARSTRHGSVAILLLLGPPAVLVYLVGHAVAPYLIYPFV